MTQAPAAPPFQGSRLLHTMLRVRDLERALSFYIDGLGMRLLRRQDFEEGRFTLAFVGYGSEDAHSVIELTYNWHGRDYAHGNAYGHIAIAVEDLAGAVALLAATGVTILRAPGPLKGDPKQHIAFVADPDGYPIELIERS